ncbi:hypothetical protein PVAP13_7NG306424 [Panicum virgatum]|uniref:Uncharacterized protein n=1 Tax=Panicum virgatum TaxID=38727 RepID=A0A8T0Q6C0_PANVG|nr:hypothetical protein PVAP13_7NG306424 [Panicum virgatum]
MATIAMLITWEVRPRDPPPWDTVASCCALFLLCICRRRSRVSEGGDGGGLFGSRIPPVASTPPVCRPAELAGPSVLQVRSRSPGDPSITSDLFTPAGRGWRCSRHATPPQRRVAGGGALLQGGADCGPRLRPRKAAWAARIGWTGRHPPCDATRCVRERSTPRHSGRKGAWCSAPVIAALSGVRSAGAGADVLIFSGYTLLDDLLPWIEDLRYLGGDEPHRPPMFILLGQLRAAGCPRVPFHGPCLY